MAREPDNNGTGQGHKGINSALIERKYEVSIANGMKNLKKIWFVPRAIAMDRYM